MAKKGQVSVLSEEEARKLAEAINHGHGQLCWLVWQAHEGKAWRAMSPPLAGFKAWVSAHLTMTEVHAYRLLNQAKRTLLLEDAAGVKVDPWDRELIGDHVRVPERHLRLLAYRGGMDPVVTAVKAAIDERQPQPQDVPDLIRDVVKQAYDVAYAEWEAEREEDRKAAERAAADVPTQVEAALDDVLALIPERLAKKDQRAWQRKEIAAKVEAIQAALGRLLGREGAKAA